MRARFLVVAVVLLGATASAESPAVGVRQLAWLQGCWETASSDRTIEEQWMAPRGNCMVGSSRTVRGGALVAYELVVITERDDRLVYLAHPSGQAAAEFTSTVVGDGSVVFENLEHDFPQRIGYQRRGEELLAWIEGSDRGQIKRIEFLYTRVHCPGE